MGGSAAGHDHSHHNHSPDPDQDHEVHHHLTEKEQLKIKNKMSNFILMKFQKVEEKKLSEQDK